MGRQTVDKFIEINNKEQRIIKEQVLNLPESTKVAIFNALKEIHTPENKYYRYSFTQKNCATEIRDLFYEHNILHQNKQLNKTYRQLLSEYTVYHPWFGFGINILMGTSVDEKVTNKDAMFLPAYLEQAVAEKEGLVKENQVLNSPEPLNYNKTFLWLTSPFVIFSLLLVISIIRSPAWFRKVFYAIFGLLGTFLVVLWIFTLHPELTNNLNVLWANPLLLLLIFFNRNSKAKRLIAYLILISLLTGLLAWLFHIQEFDWAVLPIIGLLSWFMLKELK